MTLDLDELERIAKAATPGRWSWNRPWEKDSSSSHYDGAVGCLEPGVLWFGTDGEENIYCPKEADAAHIVSFSPQTALELIRLARLGSLVHRAVKYFVKPGIYLQNMDPEGRYTGGAHWAIKTDNGMCMNHEHEFEWEPMPSSRDDAFLARCRFTFEDALSRLPKGWGREEK